MLYRRQELWLLLALAVALAVGLGVRHFRAGFPQLAERLEAFDADPAPPAALPPPSKLRPDDPESPVDLNRATSDDLRRLPGVGPTLAEEIVRARDRRGRFDHPHDLLAIPGMGPRKLERIRRLVTVGGDEGP